MARYRAAADHQRSYDVPLVLVPGERVTVIRRDTAWPDWFWCINGEGLSAWVHDEILVRHGDGAAEVRRSYSSMELSVAAGDELVGDQELGGWVWCRDEHGNEGWVPSANLEGTAP